MSNVILLVEDNPDDEELTLRALQKRARAYVGRDVRDQPQVVLLDLKLS